jgi:hypothetical protein
MHLKLFGLTLVAAITSVVSPAAAQEREWTIDQTDSDAFLLFGTPGTDDVGVSFWCKIGGKRVKLFVADAARTKPATGKRSTMKLLANQQAFSLPAQLGRQANHDHYSAETDIALGGKVLQALSVSTQFEIEFPSQNTIFPFDSDNVAAFQRVCSGGR